MPSRRVIIATAATFSLLLLITSLFCWIRSYWRFDSLMSFHVQRQWQELWIDRTMQTFRSGRVYETDSRRGQVRFLWLDNDSSYGRASLPAFFSFPLAEEERIDYGLAAWSTATHFGFAAEKAPVAEIVYNTPPPGPAMPPPATAYVIHALYTPWWIWTVLFGILPISRLIVFVRRGRRRAAGQCLRCGYDLRASPKKCPECGTIP